MRGIFARRSILTGLLTPLVLGISVVIAIGSFVSYWVVETSFTEQLTASESKVLTAANEHMAYLLKDIENLSDKIYINWSVRQILSAAPEDLSQTIRDLQGSDELSLSYMDSFFTESQLLYRWMKYDVYILGINGYRRRYSSASNAQTNILLGDVMKTDWYARVRALGGQPMVVDGAESGLSHLDGRILYTRLLKNISTNEPTGLFILSFSKQTLGYIYRTLLSDEDARLGVVARDGTSVWGSDLGGLLTQLPGGTSAGEQGAYLASPGPGRFQILYERIEGTDWYLVKALDLGVMLSFTGRLKWFVVALCALCTALVSLFSAQIARQLYRPINALLGAMRSVRNGRFETGMLDVKRDDEIGLLNRGFSEMAEELKQSLDRLIAEQNEKRRAEIQALQAQIKPHFLYNTLTSIRCVIGQGDGETAQRMIIALVKLLKSSLSNVEEFFTLAQELEILRSYALIYQIRYANFDIGLSADEAALDCLIPRMILQPLVENAIVHGLHEAGGSISIRVCAYLQGENLIIDVIDDGLGIPPERRRTLADASGRIVGDERSVGLKNVSERILFTFGATYGAQLVDAAGGGTHIRLTMPAMRSGEGGAGV